MNLSILRIAVSEIAITPFDEEMICSNCCKYILPHGSNSKRFTGINLVISMLKGGKTID